MSEGGTPSEIPNGWAWVALGELVDVLDHLRVPVSAKERTKRFGDVPYYGAAGQVGWIDEAVFNEELILLGEDGVQFFDPDKQKAYLISGPSWVNNHAHVLRPLAKVIDRRYLAHYLNCFDYEGFANGTTRLKLTKSAMLRIPVALPPLGEQQRIAGALEEQISRLDAGGRFVGDALKKAAQYSTLVAQRLLQLAGSKSSWPVTRIKDIAEVGSGSTPLRSRQEYYKDGDIPWVTSGLVNEPYVDRASQYITQKALDETSLRLLPPGTLLMAMYGEGKTRGKCAELRIWATTNQACASISLKKEFEGRKAWVKAVLQAKYEENRKLSAGGVQKNLNLGVIKNIKIPLPPMEEQDRILRELDEQMNAVARLQDEAERGMRRSLMLRRALLKQACAGQLVTQDPVEESAETLLARIRGERATLGALEPRRRSPRRAPAQRKQAPDTTPAPDAPPPPRADAPALATATQPTLDLEIPS
ncbi:hypothetical protein GCM10010233_60530 [Streptomyces pseudogriseolus]|nr:hypothetical protein GCM10010233_60530 [Streptomyces gancidicus]